MAHIGALQLDESHFEKGEHELGTVVHSYHLSTWEAEVTGWFDSEAVSAEDWTQGLTHTKQALSHISSSRKVNNGNRISYGELLCIPLLSTSKPG